MAEHFTCNEKVRGSTPRVGYHLSKTGFNRLVIFAFCTQPRARPTLQTGFWNGNRATGPPHLFFPDSPEQGAAEERESMTSSTLSQADKLACLALTTVAIFSGVYHAAKNGRLLPRLTLILPIHVIIHWYSFASNWCNVGGWRTYSLCVMAANTVLNVVGYTVLVLLYRHSVQTIFNRNVPALRRDARGRLAREPHPAVASFNAHLLLLRPLEVAFRFLSAPLRVLPDVLVLGEARCVAGGLDTPGPALLLIALTSFLLWPGAGPRTCAVVSRPWLQPPAVPTGEGD